ncbi:hypothetical protein PR048_017392 [Dryococelus australis]|uniref:Uncharacterized protein n=1 Tax=Dryococelus australis TaxID=614101 RepID=A0ABQ9H9F5_9NEOP|nr:hypothetical protein PR048_017392 [Dryococelus australis]
MTGPGSSSLLSLEPCSLCLSLPDYDSSMRLFSHDTRRRLPLQQQHNASPHRALFFSPSRLQPIGTVRSHVTACKHVFSTNSLPLPPEHPTLCLLPAARNLYSSLDNPYKLKLSTLKCHHILSKATESVPKEEVTDKNPHLKNLYEGLTMTEAQLHQVGLLQWNVRKIAGYKSHKFFSLSSHKMNSAHSNNSDVWLYFIVAAVHSLKAECLLRHAEISRGGEKLTTFNTSNCNSSKMFTKQQTLSEVLYKNFQKAVHKIFLSHKKIAEIICVNVQPISVVEDVGFCKCFLYNDRKYKFQQREVLRQRKEFFATSQNIVRAEMQCPEALHEHKPLPKDRFNFHSTDHVPLGWAMNRCMLPSSLLGALASLRSHGEACNSAYKGAPVSLEKHAGSAATRTSHYRDLLQCGLGRHVSAAHVWAAC